MTPIGFGKWTRWDEIDPQDGRAVEVLWDWVQTWETYLKNTAVGTYRYVGNGNKGVSFDLGDKPPDSYGTMTHWRYAQESPK